MNLSIFDIPLLKDGVTQYLSKRDLTHCVLTCKEWFEWFTPTLWSTVDFSHISLITPEELSALSRHQDHVLSIMGLQRYMAQFSDAQRQFRNLQSLYYTPSWASPLEDSVLLVFSLPRLRKLDLTCYQIASSIAVQQIIQTCSRFECLRLNLGNGIRTPGNGWDIGEEEREQCKSVQVTMEQMEDSQIRELGIRLSLAIQERAILLPLLERCPLLERLELKWLHDPQTLPQIIDILQARKCPRLKHVRVSSIVRSDAGEESVAGLIQALGYDGGDHEGSRDGGLGGLESFTVEAILPFERRCVQALIRCHARTLTVLDVMSLRQMKFEFFVGLVRGLPRLQSLKAAVWIWLRPDANADIDEALQTQWACLGLKELEIGLQMGDDVAIDSNHRAGNGSLADPRKAGSTGRLEADELG
ncbi:hypothetical protein EDD21DRAFT_355849 [Dissophora ornata]|nr:hypothetical protein EDD21DRAFT_355849 [Dissophora ornata]